MSIARSCQRDMSTPDGTQISMNWFVALSDPPVSSFGPSFQFTSLIHARPGLTESRIVYAENFDGSA